MKIYKKNIPLVIYERFSLKSCLRSFEDEKAKEVGKGITAKSFIIEIWNFCTFPLASWGMSERSKRAFALNPRINFLVHSSKSELNVWN